MIAQVMVRQLTSERKVWQVRRKEEKTLEKQSSDQKIISLQNQEGRPGQMRTESLVHIRSVFSCPMLTCLPSRMDEAGHTVEIETLEINVFLNWGLTGFGLPLPPSRAQERSRPIMQIDNPVTAFRRSDGG